MDTGMHITGSVTKETAENVSTGLVHIMRAGFEYHADQATIQQALQQFAAAVKVENITVTGCTFDGKTVNT